MTKKEQFAKVRAILVDKGENDLVAFIDHEVELLTAKNSRRSKLMLTAWRLNKSPRKFRSCASKKVGKLRRSVSVSAKKTP